MRFVIYTGQQIFFRCSNQGGDMQGERGMHGVGKKYTQCCEREAKGKGKTLNVYVQGAAEKPDNY